VFVAFYIFTPTLPTVGDERQYVLRSYVRPAVRRCSVNSLTSTWRALAYARYLSRLFCTYWRHFNETFWHKYSTCEWAVL